MIQFSKPESVKKVLQQTFYKMGTDRPDSRHHLLKVTRWLPQKQRHSNEELDERERSLSAEKERKFQEDLYNTVKMAGTVSYLYNTVKMAGTVSYLYNTVKMAGTVSYLYNTVKMAGTVSYLYNTVKMAGTVSYLYNTVKMAGTVSYLYNTVKMAGTVSYLYLSYTSVMFITPIFVIFHRK